MVEAGELDETEVSFDAPGVDKISERCRSVTPLPFISLTRKMRKRGEGNTLVKISAICVSVGTY